MLSTETDAKPRLPEKAKKKGPRIKQNHPLHCLDFPKDYVGIALDYAKEAADEKNSNKFCKWIRLAAKRFLNDLERAQSNDPPFTFDPWSACDPCDFIEKLPHVEGRWKDADGNYTETIILHPSDVFFIVQLFGFRTHEDHRRFTMALKAVARKNAKSTIAAAIGLYCEACEGEVGPQVISAATTGSQARIVFNIARKMVQKTSALREAFFMEAFVNAIPCWSCGGTFKPINAKASSQDGLNPSTSIIDEIHAHKTHDLLNVIQSAAGARANPLFLFTTTEGYETPGPWPELRHFAQQVLLGVVEADHFLCVYYSLDDKDEAAGIEEDSDFDESKWVKANPLLDTNPILLREIRKAAIDAKQMPGKLAEFRIKRLNRKSSTSQGFISFSHWTQCGGAVDLEFLARHPCWAGLDLASTKDIAALRLVWLVDEILYTYGKRWCPKEAVAMRTERGTVPYQGWVDQGLITMTPGEVIDHDVIVRDILKLNDRFDIQLLCYDQWNASQVAKRLKEESISTKVFIQGTKSFHPAMKIFEQLYISGKFRHGNDPVLRWCASNLVVRRDVNMNMAPDRKRSLEKIDDMVALLMACGAMLIDEPKSDPTLLFI